MHAHAVHDVRLTARPLEEFGDQRRRIHVRQHHDDVVADRRVEAGGDRGLFAEVARQAKEAHEVVPLEQRANARHRAFGGSVVDENDLVVRDDASQHRDGFLDERLHDVGRCRPRAAQRRRPVTRSCDGHGGFVDQQRGERLFHVVHAVDLGAEHGEARRVFVAAPKQNGTAVVLFAARHQRLHFPE